jgi:hypothetical protein
MDQEKLTLLFHAEFIRFINTCFAEIDEWKQLTIKEVYDASTTFSIIELIEKKTWSDYSYLDKDTREAINSVLCCFDITHKTIWVNPNNGLLLIVEIWFRAYISFAKDRKFMLEAINHKRNNLT